jgi:hypothetical protein
MVAEFFEFAFGAAVSEFLDGEGATAVAWSPVFRQSLTAFWGFCFGYEFRFGRAHPRAPHGRNRRFLTWRGGGRVNFFKGSVRGFFFIRDGGGGVCGFCGHPLKSADALPFTISSATPLGLLIRHNDGNRLTLRKSICNSADKIRIDASLDEVGDQRSDAHARLTSSVALRTASTT